MHAAGTQPVFDLDSPWPEFLDFLDSDPRHALEGLHTFAWKLSEARPPAIMRRLDPADRQDLISDLVLSCCSDDFRKLRRYQNVGKPFAAWLTTVFVRQVLDWLRRQRRTEELPDEFGAVEGDPPPGPTDRVVDCLHRCLGRMTEKCRLYLACAADGMKPREIALLLNLPEGENKRVSDDLRHCMRKLREMLLAEGVDPEEMAR
jgi:RNA polymerase sigma factor (sigma-70 family)